MTRGPFDEIARKNCPELAAKITSLFKNWDYDDAWDLAESEVLDMLGSHGSRLAQAAVEATEEHWQYWHQPCECRCQSCRSCADCQSDILRRTEEKLK